jgi:type IV pilus assembly protein PilB
MVMSEKIRDLVIEGATAGRIKRIAIEEGMTTLRMSGIQKILAGMTTIEEVLGTTVADEV